MKNNLDNQHQKSEFEKQEIETSALIFKANHTFYKHVVESLEDYAVFTTDKRGIINTWNLGAERLLFYTENEIIGKSAAILFTKEDNEKAAPAIELEGAYFNGKALDERYHVKKDGSIFWASGMVFPLFDEEHEHIGFTKIMRNLNERKIAEQNMLAANIYAQGIIETARNPMIILNNDFSISSANDAFYKKFNVSKEHSTGKSFFEINDGQWKNLPELKELLSIVNHEKDLATAKIEYEFMMLGTLILEFTIRKLFRQEMPKEMILIAIEDITAKIELEREKEDFIGVASHELRTPITSIKAYTQIIEKKIGRTEDKILSNSIKRSLELLNKLGILITTLLDVSRLRTGKLDLKKEPFELSKLIEETIAHVQILSQSHKIVLANTIDIFVLGDRVWIEQVMTNLLTNAIKFSPDAHRVIITMRLDSDDARIIVSVQDFGIGIPMSEFDKVFRKFARTSNVIQKHIAGIGIGLHLCSEIINMHQGKMWFESEENRGSNFYFSIPIDL